MAPFANLELLGFGGADALLNTAKRDRHACGQHRLGQPRQRVSTDHRLRRDFLSGNATIAATGNLTITVGACVVVGATGNFGLSATANFINNEGSDAVSTSGTGRWLFYLAGPGKDTFGNLDSAT